MTLRKSGKWPRHLVQRIVEAGRLGPALINAAQAEPGIGSPAHGKPPEEVYGITWLTIGLSGLLAVTNWIGLYLMIRGLAG